MESTNISVERVAVKYGFLTAAGLAIYFLAMKLVGLVHIIELRSLNLFIMVAGLWFALKYYRENSTSHLNYFEGISLGTLTAAIAVIPFSIFDDQDGVPNGYEGVRLWIEIGLKIEVPFREVP